MNNKGKIKQIIGPIIDVEFESGKLPAILTSLLLSMTITVAYFCASRGKSIGQNA